MIMFGPKKTVSGPKQRVRGPKRQRQGFKWQSGGSNRSSQRGGQKAAKLGPIKPCWRSKGMSQGPWSVNQDPRVKAKNGQVGAQMAKKLKIFLCPNNLCKYKYGAEIEVTCFWTTNVFLEKEFCQTKKIIDKLFCQNSLRHSFFSKSWVKYHSTIILSKIFWQYLSKSF